MKFKGLFVVFMKNKDSFQSEKEGQNSGDQKQEDESLLKAWWQPAILIFTKMSAWIIFPVVLGAFLGRYLDSRWDSEPWIFLGAVVLAFALSVYGLIKTAREELKKMDNDKED